MRKARLRRYRRTLGRGACRSTEATRGRYSRKPDRVKNRSTPAGRWRRAKRLSRPRFTRCPSGALYIQQWKTRTLAAARARSPSTPASRAPDWAGAGGAVTSQGRLRPTRARRRGRREFGLPGLGKWRLEAFLTNRASPPSSLGSVSAAPVQRLPARLPVAVSAAVADQAKPRKLRRFWPLQSGL